MKMVTLEVRSPDEAMSEFVHAWKAGKPECTARISFATPELLWKVLTAKRWELLKASIDLICGPCRWWDEGLNLIARIAPLYGRERQQTSRTPR